MNLSRRDALKITTAGLAGLSFAPLALRAEEDKKPAGYTLPRLPYAYDALEPHIDAVTMETHHSKHHQAYINNANGLLKAEPALLAKPVDELLKDIKSVPEKIRQGVINNAGGHSNHSIFWQTMSPKGGGDPKGELAKAIETAFKSVDAFKKDLTASATTVFGSGWAWLVVEKGALKIVQKKNQDSPFMDGQYPLVGVDVWEHAYYLKYKNLRPAYLAAWWKVVAWDVVAERYEAAKK